MNKKNVIGGEFEITSNNLASFVKTYKNPEEDIMTYASGRSSLYYILSDAKKRFGINKILLPDYLCHSIYATAVKAEVVVDFYSLSENLELQKENLSNLYDKKTAVLLINYFGLQNLSKQKEILRSIDKEILIIEDDVQAYYEFQKPLFDADYKFTSLRKTFAIPDGGLVKSLHVLDSPKQPNKFFQYKMGASILKALRKPEYFDDDIYMQLFESGESRIDDDITCGISQIANMLRKKIDYSRFSLIRKRNAKVILEGLADLGIQTILPVTDMCTPLFVPVYLKDRNRVRREMFAESIFCPVHWPIEGLSLSKGTEMAEHELSIIIDQRYTTKDMKRILNVLEKSK